MEAIRIMLMVTYVLLAPDIVLFTLVALIFVACKLIGVGRE
jgi:hypothetical protein